MSEDELGPAELLDELREMVGQKHLESMAPDRAIDLWFGQLDDPSESTLQSSHYRIDPFIQWSQKQGVDDLTDLTPRHGKEFEARRRSSIDNKNTLNNQFGTIPVSLLPLRARCDKRRRFRGDERPVSLQR